MNFVSLEDIHCGLFYLAVNKSLTDDKKIIVSLIDCKSNTFHTFFHIKGSLILYSDTSTEKKKIITAI